MKSGQLHSIRSAPRDTRYAPGPLWDLTVNRSSFTCSIAPGRAAICRPFSQRSLSNSAAPSLSALADIDYFTTSYTTYVYKIRVA